MNMGDFYPISPLVGITNTSYAAQAGVMDEKWAIRVVRGKKIIAEKTMNSLDLESMVGVIYGHARIEGLSRHSVAMCAGRLMQFARRYQESGICPNYEIPDLVRSDGTRVGTQTSAETEQITSSDASLPTPESVAETAEERSFAHLGAVPKIAPLGGKDLWKSCVNARGHLVVGMAIYGGGLPEGHLEAMFRRVADNLIHEWGRSGDANDLIRGFATLIQSCSEENQIPVTSGNDVTIETGTCQLRRLARELDPEMKHIPRGYPCAFHEELGRRIAELTGVKIHINTSSTGCRVTLSVE